VQLFHVNIRNNKTGGRKITNRGKKKLRDRERKKENPKPHFLSFSLVSYRNKQRLSQNLTISAHFSHSHENLQNYGFLESVDW
jgi:hypothetical protein